MKKPFTIQKGATYNEIIKDAIINHPDGTASSSQIFKYIKNKYPEQFNNSNSLTWKRNISQMLSKNPEFIKLGKSSADFDKSYIYSYKPVEQLIDEENKLMNCLKDPSKTIHNKNKANKEFWQNNFYLRNCINKEKSINYKNSIENNRENDQIQPDITNNDTMNNTTANNIKYKSYIDYLNYINMNDYSIENNKNCTENSNGLENKCECYISSKVEYHKKFYNDFYKEFYENFYKEYYKNNK